MSIKGAVVGIDKKRQMGYCALIVILQEAAGENTFFKGGGAMRRKIIPIYDAGAEKLLAYFRELVVVDPERVETVEDAERMTVQGERDWILGIEKKMLAGNMYALCVEVTNGEETSIVAVAEVERLPRQIESHMGEIRLGILPEYAFYGTKIVQSLCHHAKEIGIESLLYTHFETQKIGIEIMKSCGFLRIGYIPDYYKRGGTYTGRIIMLLPKL